MKDDGFVSGDILVMLAEDISERCGPAPGYSAATPGDTIAQSVLAGPGPYSVKGEVRWVKYVPDLDLIIWSRRDDGACHGGAHRSLPAGDASNVDLVAIEGPCPMRM